MLRVSAIAGNEIKLSVKNRTVSSMIIIDFESESVVLRRKDHDERRQY